MFVDFDALAALNENGDRDRGWQFVRAVAEAFDRPIVEGDGIDPGELAVIEERSGTALPAALREAYLLFGRRADLTATQDFLLPPEQPRVDLDSVLEFRVENQDCARWGVPAAAFGRDDPPVVLNIGDGWVPYSDRLSLALVEMVLSESMFSAGNLVTDNRELDDAAHATLVAGFERLPLPDFPFWAAPADPPIRWYAGPDVLLRADGAAWLWVHARTPAALRTVRDRIPGDWLMAFE